MQLKPDDADLWRQMGNALICAGRSAEALLCFQYALELDPGQGDAAYKVGVLLKEEERFDEALVYLDRSADAQPDHAPYEPTSLIETVNENGKGSIKPLRLRLIDRQILR